MKKSYKCRRWTKEEDKFIIDNYKILSAKKISNLLNKNNSSSVYNRINRLRRMGCKLEKMDKWDEESIDFLKENYQNLKNKTMSKILGRTIKSIGYKGKSLKLCEEKKKISDEDVEKIIYLYSTKKLSVPKIARLIGRSKCPIYKILKENNVSLNSRTNYLKLNPDWHKKTAIKLKMKYNSGEFINPCKGKKREDLKKRNLEDNPMKNREIVKKVVDKLKGRESKFLGKSCEEIYGKERASEIRSKIKEKRKELILPKKDTKIEKKIQRFLKRLGLEFYTHKYMNIKHGYQCDILIPSMSLVIECDGNYWHKYPIGREIDKIRTSELLENGFKVLRLWGSEIRNIDIHKFRGRLNEKNNI